MAFTYKGLTAQMCRYFVTDEDVERQLLRLQQENPRIAIIEDRPTENGDEIVLDYAGFCDGERFAGGTAQNQTLVLGSNTFIPGFEEQLLDKVPGEEVTVNVTFPEEYHAEALAGKEARFDCVIRQIRVKTPYELDDTFAKEVGKCDTLDEMKQKMRKSLQDYTDERGEMDLQDELLRQAADSLEMEISDAELEKAIDQQIDNMKAQLAQQGLNIEMYCSFMDCSIDDLRRDVGPTAAAALRSQMAVQRIVELEKLEATSEEIAEALAVVSRQNNVTLDQIKEMYDAELEKAIVNSVLTGKVMRLIRDAANVTVV